mmetsp:Transcript_4618/g.7166  ORF Transcript_4618/g.7166 Transcript_4618/m.7166 type:complete len:626 (+) Transcript_4618:151-2028(+)
MLAHKSHKNGRRRRRRSSVSRSTASDDSTCSGSTTYWEDPQDPDIDSDAQFPPIPQKSRVKELVSAPAGGNGLQLPAIEGRQGAKSPGRGGRADSETKILVTLRKRPLSDKESARKDVDTVQILEDHLVSVKESKQKVDLSAYVESSQFFFDVALDESSTNEDVYLRSVEPLLSCVFDHGKASCFAYGQTGSGKTFTMMGSNATGMGLANAKAAASIPNPGVYLLAARDIYARLKGHEYHGWSVWVSFFEIYCNVLYDLLNARHKMVIRADAEGSMKIVGLTEFPAPNVESLMKTIKAGLVARVTGETGANNTSSRSHAVLQIILKDGHGVEAGRLSVIDLAGNERGADTVAQDRQRRQEGSEINKSLLALKECIRSLAMDLPHVPFRGSVLTTVLRDSFVGNSACSMIACISPASGSVEPTLNTLRYADRVKGLKVPARMRVAPSPVRPRDPPQPPPRQKSMGPLSHPVSALNDFDSMDEADPPNRQDLSRLSLPDIYLKDGSSPEGKSSAAANGGSVAKRKAKHPTTGMPPRAPLPSSQSALLDRALLAKAHRAFNNNVVRMLNDGLELLRTFEKDPRVSPLAHAAMLNELLGKLGNAGVDLRSMLAPYQQVSASQSKAPGWV